MSRPPKCSGLFVFGLATAVFVLASGRSAIAAQDPPPDPTGGLPPGAEALTQGPVHEAFAGPVVFDPKAGPVIPKQPPQTVQEVPPDQKPAGDHVQWISGYWAWDDQRNDFLWVSGIWRIPPPGRQWVPGYWNTVTGGFQWVPGAWVPVAAQDPNAQGQQQYLPAPPASIEAGPNVPSPATGAVWAPGCWYWQPTGYAWRPGYWVVPQNNWIWIPAHYVWTPGGYLFVNGYWDHALDQRGVMFAPVYFSQPVYAQQTFVYTPSISLVAAGLLANLFVRPTYGVYYFGDYYASSYFSVGIYPWYSFHQSRYGYDPIYAHAYAINIARNPRWAEEMHDAYRFRREHIEARPPRTWAEQVRVVNRVNVTNVTNITNVTNVRNVAMAQPVSHMASQMNAAAGSHMRFETINAAQRQAAVQQSAQLHQFREERARQEVQASRTNEHLSQPRPSALPRSPITSPHASGAAGREASAVVGQDRRSYNPPPAPAHPGVQSGPRPGGAGEVSGRHEPHPDNHPPQPHQVRPTREARSNNRNARER
jgi:hypothetical protein